MSHWNYRVVKVDDGTAKEYVYEIREVFYNSMDAICGMSETGVNPVGENIEELKADLHLMEMAFNKPILHLSEMVYGPWDYEVKLTLDTNEVTSPHEN